MATKARKKEPVVAPPRLQNIPPEAQNGHKVDFDLSDVLSEPVRIRGRDGKVFLTTDDIPPNLLGRISGWLDDYQSSLLTHETTVQDDDLYDMTATVLRCTPDEARDLGTAACMQALRFLVLKHNGKLRATPLLEQLSSSPSSQKEPST